MAAKKEIVPLMLRLPRQLHRKLVKTAGRHSLNSEIVRRLEDSFLPPPEPIDYEEFASEIIRKVSSGLEDFGDTKGKVKK